MQNESFEMLKCQRYLDNAAPELDSTTWLSYQRNLPAILLTEGFEERSLGVLRAIASRGLQVPYLLLARYEETEHLNRQYRDEFAHLAQIVAPGRHDIVWSRSDGSWISDRIQRIGRGMVLLDISGMTTRGMFAALDVLKSAGNPVLIGYSEAEEYRPTRVEWDALVGEITGDPDEESLLAEKVDEAKWLYSGAHTVQLLPGHEGYDAAGVNALVAFLPFKPVRLGTVLDEQEYSAYVYMVGRPRLDANSWRYNALQRINTAIIREGRMVEVPTFGYRETISALATVVAGSSGLLNEFDVHLAPMGSKLQNVACWILSSLIPAITVITSVPDTWYHDAFSHGVGDCWVFPLKFPASLRV